MKLKAAYDAYRQEQTDGNAAFFLIKKKTAVGDAKDFAVGRLQDWNSFFEDVAHDEVLLTIASAFLGTS